LLIYHSLSNEVLNLRYYSYVHLKVSSFSDVINKFFVCYLKLYSVSQTDCQHPNKKQTIIWGIEVRYKKIRFFLSFCFNNHFSTSRCILLSHSLAPPEKMVPNTEAGSSHVGFSLSSRALKEGEVSPYKIVLAMFIREAFSVSEMQSPQPPPDTVDDEKAKKVVSEEDKKTRILIFIHQLINVS